MILSVESFVAHGFYLILSKLAQSACWLEGVVCPLQDVEGGFYLNLVKWGYLSVTSSGGYTMVVLGNYVKLVLRNAFPITAKGGNA